MKLKNEIKKEIKKMLDKLKKIVYNIIVSENYKQFFTSEKKHLTN